MKTFKSFIAEEKPNIKRKAKGEQDFVDAHEVEVTDKTDQANNSAKVTTKAGSGKHKNDRQDNKQEFGEEVEEIDEISGELAKRVYNTRRMHSDNWKITPTQKRRLKMGIDDGHPFRNVVIAQRSAKKRLAKEEVELEEETKTYMVKFEKNGKVSLKNYEAKSDLDARSKAKVDAKRMGMEVSSVRLKEEIELQESQVHKIEKQKDGTHKVHVKTEYGEIKHIGTIHPPVRPNLDPSYIAKYKDGSKVAVGKNIEDLAKRLSGYHGKTMREETELDEKMVNPGLERLAAAKKRQQPSHTNPGLEALAKKKKSLRELRKSVNEADFSKKETKMAHTIGKEFEKKGVGDEAQGGPYAVASAMVRDKPEAAKKAYKTIQSKMKEEADAELLFNLYNDLNEENQEMFMSQLEEDAEALLEFAQRFLAD